MVDKKNSMDMHRVTHLSYPEGASINVFIEPLDAETHSQTFKSAVNLVDKAGHRSFMAKEDFKSAFHNILIALAEKRDGLKFVHYLDDFFTIHRLNMVCNSIMSVFKLVCD